MPTCQSFSLKPNLCTCTFASVYIVVIAVSLTQPQSRYDGLSPADTFMAASLLLVIKSALGRLSVSFVAVSLSSSLSLCDGSHKLLGDWQ